MKQLQTVWAAAVCVGIAGASHAAPGGTATLKPAKGFDISITRTEPDGQYLVDVQQQYEGHDHIAMVGEVLEALMNRQPRKAS